MINAKTLIMSLLSQDTELITLLGGNENIFGAYPDEIAVFPSITFFEVDNVPELIGDGQELASSVLMQVDVWVQDGSTTPIVQKVNSILQGAGFKRTSCRDMDSVDTTPIIRRKIMQFELIK
jgi:hypothetical protein